MLERQPSVTLATHVSIIMVPYADPWRNVLQQGCERSIQLSELMVLTCALNLDQARLRAGVRSLLSLDRLTEDGRCQAN